MSLSLFGTSELDDDQQQELARSMLKGLISSYADEADIFTELVQNAYDAVIARQQMESDYVGTITVVFGRRTNDDHYIYVQDDGIGMTPKIARKVFIPGYTYGKRKGSTIGYKGVGLSYVIAVSNHLAVITSRNDETTAWTIRHTNEWVQSAEKPDPIQTNVFEAPEYVEGLAAENVRGTGFYFALHPSHKPSTLSHQVSSVDDSLVELRRWAALVSTRTPLGVALSEESMPSKPVNVRLVMDRGSDDVSVLNVSRSKWDLDQNQIGYPFPHKVFHSGSDIAAIDTATIPQRDTQHLKRHNAVWHYWSADEIMAGMQLEDTDREFLAAHLDWVYGYYCYSTEILAHVNSELGVVRTPVRYGARLVVDGAPQGRAIDLALTSDQGLDRQTHIVISLKNTELDLGRKVISDENLIRVIQRVNSRVVTNLKEYRPYLRVRPRPDVAEDIASWIADVAGRAGNSPIAEMFDLIKTTATVLVEPSNEQETIALWSGIVASGVLPGYGIKALSGSARYDALVEISDEAFAQVGELAPVMSSPLIKENAVVEFKFHFEELISNFESGEKKPGEIDLAICWDLPNLNVRKGTLKPVYGKWKADRPMRAVSYVWSDTDGQLSFPVIALQNVVAELMHALTSPHETSYMNILQRRDEPHTI